MYVPGCKFEDRSCYIQGNGDKDNGVNVKLKGNVNVKYVNVEPVGRSYEDF